MPMFVVLGRLTDEGSKNVADFVAATEENFARATSLGIKNHGWYMTQGHYDFVVIAEAPDAETTMKQLFGVRSSGRVRTETLRAFTLDEIRQLLPT